MKKKNKVVNTTEQTDDVEDLFEFDEDDGISTIEDDNEKKSENFLIKIKRFFAKIFSSKDNDKAKKTVMPSVIVVAVAIFLVFIISDFAAGGILYVANGKVAATVYGGKTQKFSVNTDADTVYDMISYDDAFALLTEKGISYINSKGKIKASQQLTYSVPALAANDNRVMIYDRGNEIYSLQVNEQYANQFVAAGEIIDAAVSGNKNYALAVRDENSKTALYGYNASGELIYQWNCPSGYIFDVAITNAGGKAVACVVNSKNAVLNSTVYILDFEYDSEYANFEFNDETVLGAKFLTNRRVQVITDKKVYLIKGDNVSVVNEFGSADVVLTDLSQKISAVITRDYSHDDSYNLLMFGSNGKFKRTVPLSGKVRGLSVSDKGLAVLFADKTETYSKNGKLVGSSENANFYDDIILNGNYIYLLSADSVKKIPAYGTISIKATQEEHT